MLLFKILKIFSVYHVYKIYYYYLLLKTLKIVVYMDYLFSPCPPKFLLTIPKDSHRCVRIVFLTVEL